MHRNRLFTEDTSWQSTFIRTPRKMVGPTCGDASADGNALLVLEDGVHADQVLHAGLQLLDGGHLLVPRDPHVHLQAPDGRGHVGDQVLRHHHLVHPGQVHRLSVHPHHRQVLGG